jgi:hypothetical protein
MELDAFTQENLDSIPPIEVICGGETHQVRAVETPEEGFGLECVNHHGGSLVVALLGGNRSACHQMVDELTQTSLRLKISLRHATEWYAYKFNWTTMQAWHKYGGPREAAEWVAAGLTPANVRVLHGLGITDLCEYHLWEQACQYGTKIDINVIRDYMEQGVVSGAEALAWRQAGLARPAQLVALRKRGINSPEKLVKRRQKELAAA